MRRAYLELPGVLLAAVLAASCQPAFSADDTPPTPEQISQLVAERGGRVVTTRLPDGKPSVALELGGSEVSDSDLKRLIAMPGLTRLDLSASLITDGQERLKREA